MNVWMPELFGEIERRLLFNYHVDPETLVRVLPAPFQPQFVNGVGVAGTHRRSEAGLVYQLEKVEALIVSVVSSARLFRRLRAALTGGLLITVALSTPAAARTMVDPSTLNPAPPESFNAVCYREGGHITCSLAVSDPDVVTEPTGIICDGTELLNSFERSVVGKRFYDRFVNHQPILGRDHCGRPSVRPEGGRTCSADC